MEKIAKTVIALGSTLLCFSAAYSGIPNQDHPTTFLGPTLKGRYTSPINEISAYSLLGEAGLKDLRVGGTLGWKLATNQRLKLSAEWLRQNITYAFFSGNSEQWMNQWAFGAGYQYDFMGYNDGYQPSFDLDAYYSHAPSKTLSTKTGTYINSLGNFRTFVDQRRIAGSNAAGIAPGFSFTPWINSRAGIELNYDNVRYDKRFSPNHDAKGFGGTLRLDQGLTENVGLGLAAAIRQPFNNYTANLNWSTPYLGGIWTLGIDGAYTVGKETLPNTWNIGLSIDYLLVPCPTPVPANLKGDYKGEASLAPVNDPFWAWAAKPAVYMPQVLAIVDEHVTTGCGDRTPPVTIGTIANRLIPLDVTLTIPTSQAFSGNHLTFSVMADPIHPANTVTIDPVSGVVTVAAHADDSFEVTVIASNSCGSTSTSFHVTIGDT